MVFIVYYVAALKLAAIPGYCIYSSSVNIIAVSVAAPCCKSPLLVNNCCYVASCCRCSIFIKDFFFFFGLNSVFLFYFILFTFFFHFFLYIYIFFILTINNQFFFSFHLQQRRCSRYSRLSRCSKLVSS